MTTSQETAFEKAERERVEKEAADDKEKGVRAKVAGVLNALLERAIAERLKRGEHASCRDMADFLAENGVRIPRELKAEDMRAPDHWPKLGLASE